MKHTRLIIAALLILILAGNADAFDYNRKGFVVGAGPGYAPVLRRSGGDDPSYDKDGLASEFLVGYAWNDQNAVFLLVDVGIYEEDVDILYNGFVVYRDHREVSQGFVGPCFRHYFSAKPQSFFVQGAFGSVSWIPDEPFGCHSGPGFLVGAGYEFIKHVNVEANLAWGTSNERRHANDYTLVSITVCGTLY